MIQGIGKFINRPTKTGGKTYDKFFIYIPTSVAKDSAFPFKPGEEVVIKIDGDRLVVERPSRNEKSIFTANCKIKRYIP